MGLSLPFLCSDRALCVHYPVFYSFFVEVDCQVQRVEPVRWYFADYGRELDYFYYRPLVFFLEGSHQIFYDVRGEVLVALCQFLNF